MAALCLQCHHHATLKSVCAKVYLIRPSWVPGGFHGPIKVELGYDEAPHQTPGNA